MWPILRLPRIGVKVQADDDGLLLSLLALIPARDHTCHVIVVAVDVEHTHCIPLLKHTLHDVSRALVVLMHVPYQLGSLLWLSRVQEK